MFRRVADLPVLLRMDLAARRRRTMSRCQRKMVSGVTSSLSPWRRAFGIAPSRIASSAPSARFSFGRRGCRRCSTASWWRRTKISAISHISLRWDSRSHEAVRVIRKTNRRQMTGDHHSQATGMATLLVRAVDVVLGTTGVGGPFAGRQLKGTVVQNHCTPGSRSGCGSHGGAARWSALTSHSQPAPPGTTVRVCYIVPTLEAPWPRVTSYSNIHVTFRAEL